MSYRFVAASLTPFLAMCFIHPAIAQSSAAPSSKIELPKTSAAELRAKNASSVSIVQLSIPSGARSLYKKAASALDHGNLTESFDKVNAALAICPKFPEALVLRGALQREAGKPAEAITDFQQAIQYDANYGVAHLALASVFNSSGRFAESLPALAQARRLAPNVWQIYFEFARAYMGIGKFDDALRNLDEASLRHGGATKELPEMHLLRAYALIEVKQAPRAANEIEAYLASKPGGDAADNAREALNKLRAPTIDASQ